MKTSIESPDFQRVMQLSHSSDRTALNLALERHLAGAQGQDRAFWLRVRAYQRASGAPLSHVLDAAWADLEEALRLAPDDPVNRANTLAAALNICLVMERAELFVRTLNGMRNCYRLVDPTAPVWQYVGTMHMKRRRWHQAARAFGRSIAEFERLEPLRKELYANRLAHCYARYAVCLIRCGRIDQGAAMTALALTLAEKHPPESLNHVLFATAQAELALHAGRLQEARAALQRGLMLDSGANRPKQEASQAAETELLAARIARAEGNTVGFAHFCEKALEICKEYKLPLTEARVRAVMAGAAN